MLENCKYKFRYKSYSSWTNACKYYVNFEFRFPEIGEFVPGIGYLEEIKIKNIIFIK